MKNKSLFKYALLFFIPLIIDRVTKSLALDGVFNDRSLGILSFDLTKNRGISLSFFHSDNGNTFLLVSVIIVFIIMLLLVHMWHAIKNGKSVIGETLILSGAISNLIDRIVHSGVIDFIIINLFGWSMPIFNLADVFIIIGSILMFINNLD